MNYEKIELGIAELWDYAQGMSDELTVTELADELSASFEEFESAKHRSQKKLDRMLQYIDMIWALECNTEAYPDRYSFDDEQRKNYEIVTKVWFETYNLSLEILSWYEEFYPQKLQDDNQYVDVRSDFETLKDSDIEKEKNKINSELDLTNIQPINWLKGDELLEQFINSLKSAALIENRETDIIIQEHFKQTDQEPQPIQWTKSNRLINYLFSKLTEADLIDTMDRKFKLITEHFLDKKGQAFKRDSLKQDAQNMKYSSDPRGSETVDSIINNLTG